MKTEHYDFVVIGAGVIGLTVARELVLRNAGRILVLEKERQIGMHASGRSSGVIHTGIYYDPDSLKGRLCAEGSRQWQAYARAHDIPYVRTGKVIVAQTAASVPELYKLRERAYANGVRVRPLTPYELYTVEPEAHTMELALHSPDTAVIDTTQALAALRGELALHRVALECHSEVRSINLNDQSIQIRDTLYIFDHLVNCAGLHADRIAHACGVGQQYRILPFRGTYKKLNHECGHRIRGSIYPTPDPRMPFLGVHVTRCIDGSVSVGPTAFPAFGREHYRCLTGIQLTEAAVMGWRLSKMFIQNTDGLRSHVADELRRRMPGAFVKDVRSLIPFITSRDITRSDKCGLRAQLVNVATNKFVMDFVVERGPHSTHVLNAVSPGFTCAFPFASHVVDRILEKKKS